MMKTLQKESDNIKNELKKKLGKKFSWTSNEIKIKKESSGK